MTKSDFADLMLGRKIQPKVRSALFLVLVKGKGQTDAANELGIQRQQVNRALSNLHRNCTTKQERW